MEHFSTQKWVDFVRGKADSSTARELQAHLDRGCLACLKSADLWGFVMQQTRRSKRTQPPDSSMRAVRNSFRLRKVVPFPSGRLDLATLQFDSNRALLATGTRSVQASGRQLLYKSGSVCIDMRMEPTPGSDSIVLIGQLLDSMNPGQGIADVPVSLLSKGDTLSRKRTNDAGEFDFGLEPAKDMQLVFGIGDSRTIVVSVPEAGANASGKLM